MRTEPVVASAHGRPSVLTVTVNPAVDVSIDVEQMVPDHKLRADSWTREPGGGGVNVARVLHRFGVAVEAFVVAGGATGDELVTMVATGGVSVRRFITAGTTRESVAVSETSTGRQYRIAAPGPSLDDSDALCDAIVAAATDVGLIVLLAACVPASPATSSRRSSRPSQRELAALVRWNPVPGRHATRLTVRASVPSVSWGSGRCAVVQAASTRRTCRPGSACVVLFAIGSRITSTPS